MESKLLKKFNDVDISAFPDFYKCNGPLERGLWVLWVAKEKLKLKKLSADQIASIIIEIKEISIKAKSITRSFSRAGDKIHTYQEDGEVYFEIMKPGKEYLISQKKEDSIEAVYFEPGKRFTSKRTLSKNILKQLKGNLKIVDPYCGTRTLDILSKINNNVQFLTRIENLRGSQGKRFLRELKDFKTEKPNVEFRSYPKTDIHDRYVISSEVLIILGHSIKDLGGKESFAVALDIKTNKDITDSLIVNFNKRWKQSKAL